MTEKRSIDEHVGELLSGFIDEVLTQQDQQRVQLHCENCEACKNSLQEIRAVRETIAQSRLSELGQDVWRETLDDAATKTTRGFGWLLLLGGIVLAGAVGMYELFTGASTMTLAEKMIVGGLYGGMLLLFISVLRQRLIERKTDKYKDVEI